MWESIYLCHLDRSTKQSITYDVLSIANLKNLWRCYVGFMNPMIFDTARYNMFERRNIDVRRIWMKNATWVPFLISAAVLVGVSGCGNSSPSNSTATAASNSVAATAPANNDQGQHGHFQPNITMTTNPSSVTAGKQFTIIFSMQRPNQGSNHQNGGGNWSGKGGHHPRNRAGGQDAAGIAPTQPDVTVKITGNGVNQIVHLVNQNHSFEGKATIQKAGTYQAVFSMNMGLGSRQIEKNFTLQVH